MNGTVLTDKEGIGIDLGVKELAVCSDEKNKKGIRTNKTRTKFYLYGRFHIKKDLKLSVST